MPRNYDHSDEMREAARERERKRRERLNSFPKEWRKADKELTLQMFEYRCGYCGDPEGEASLEFDHYIDVWEELFPGTLCGNMVPSCRSCNRRKNDRGADYILTPEKKAEVENTLSMLGGGPF